MVRPVIDAIEALIHRIAHESIEPAHSCESNKLNVCWFMTPTEHAEYLFSMCIVMASAAYGFMKLSGDRLGFDVKITDTQCPPYPLYWKVILIGLLSYLGMKWEDPGRMLTSALAPCNFIHIVCCIGVLTPNPSARHHIARWGLHQLAFVLAPLLKPDIRTLSPLETFLFFAIHIVVPVFLLYNVVTQRVHPLKEKLSTMLGLCCLMIMASSIVQTFTSFLIAMNINYQLYPPPALSVLKETPRFYKWGGSLFSLGLWLAGCTIVVAFTFVLKWVNLMYGNLSKATISVDASPRRVNSPRKKKLVD